MSTHHGRAGDGVRLGSCVGVGIEPDVRLGRVVAFIKRDEDGRVHERPKVVVRKYVQADRDYPTGDYITTGMLFPHEVPPGGTCEDCDCLTPLDELFPPKAAS